MSQHFDEIQSSISINMMSIRLCSHKRFKTLYGALVSLWTPKNLANCDPLYLLQYLSVSCSNACFGYIRIWVIQIEGVLSAHNQSSLWCLCGAVLHGQ